MTDDNDSPLSRHDALLNDYLAVPQPSLLHTLFLLLAIKVCMQRQNLVDLGKYRELCSLTEAWAEVAKEEIDESPTYRS